MPKGSQTKRRPNARAILKIKPEARIAAAIARSPKKIVEISQERKIMKLVQAGESYDNIGVEFGISANDAYTIAKKTIEKWCKELTLTTTEQRELDLKRLDAVMVILWKDIEPSVMVDGNGKTVIDGVTGLPVMRGGDKVAIKLFLDVIDRRSKLLGTEAATKLDVGGTIDLIRREYVGADPNSL